MKKYIVPALTALILSTTASAADTKLATSEFNPFEEVQKMQQEMDKIFESFHKKMINEDVFSKFDSSFVATVDIDLKDEGDKYLLKADIPGSKKSEIHITTKEGMLKIEAKSSESKEEKKKNFLKKERFSGSFLRILSLPKDADADKLKSDYKDGVLKISIPKKKS